MVQPSRVVAITGASGYVGSRLLRQLEEEDMEKLVGIDTRPPPLPIHNIAVYRRDVEGSIEDILRRHRVTTLVHLAFSKHLGRYRREIRELRDQNRKLLDRVLESSLRAGVSQIIYLSSHTVYGARWDNPVPLTERAPLLVSPEFPYGYDNFLADQTLDTFAEENQQIKVAVLRCSQVLGPGAHGDLFNIFLQSRPMGIRGFDPPFQFFHEDDLARVLTIFIKRELSGVFNVAGDGVAFLREVAEMVSGRITRLPKFLAYPLVNLTWALGLQRSKTTADLDVLRYPALLSTGKLEQATGYRPHYNSLETVTAFVNSVLP